MPTQPRASDMTVNIIKDIYVNGNNEHVSQFNNEIKSQFIVLSF